MYRIRIHLVNLFKGCLVELWTSKNKCNPRAFSETKISGDYKVNVNSPLCLNTKSWRCMGKLNQNSTHLMVSFMLQLFYPWGRIFRYRLNINSYFPNTQSGRPNRMPDARFPAKHEVFFHHHGETASRGRQLPIWSITEDTSSVIRMRKY